jgi:hypothetical protein
MKLLLKEYLASLKERNELDAILPELLSQMGLNVISKPSRGTRQDGVDVAAVGSLNGEEEKVYLFSIKPGDLTRKDWSTDSPQSLRPSLDEIRDAYIPSKIDPEHRSKKIVICVCVGGEIAEQLRTNVAGYCSQNTTQHVEYQTWNGDKLSSLIQESFLQENLLPDCRSLLRKSLAMVEEPEASHKYFIELCQAITASGSNGGMDGITSLRQLALCLWILYSWGRDRQTLESPYLSAEIGLLHGWKLFSQYLQAKNRHSISAQNAFTSIFRAYQQISSNYLSLNVNPYADSLHGISSAINSANSLDVNLKLFDIIGRVGIDGIWAFWGIDKLQTEDVDAKRAHFLEAQENANNIKRLINHNSALFSPISDDQAIDIDIAALLMAFVEDGGDNISSWLDGIIEQSIFSYELHGKYPSTISEYDKLLSHPEEKTEEYQKAVTKGSILYPYIAFWSAALAGNQAYSRLVSFQGSKCTHCTYQIWFPDDLSEEMLYTNTGTHGTSLASIHLPENISEYIPMIESECNATNHFDNLSAVKFGFWPIILVACRVYRLPIPMNIKIHVCKKFSATA